MSKSTYVMDVSKLNTSSKMQLVRIDSIIENEKNFFSVEEDITDLAESIQAQGLLQPLVVRPIEGDQYRLIAGHRRLKALKYLQSNDPLRWQSVMCNIVEPTTDEVEELMLIQTNTEAREIGWHEKNQAAKRVEEILVKMQKEQGVKLPGKMRTHIAKIIKTSEAAIARAKVIDEHMIPEFKEEAKTKKGIFNDDLCYRLAQLPAEEQREIFDKCYKKYNYDLTANWLKRYHELKAEGKDPFKKENLPDPKRSCYRVVLMNGKYPDCSVADAIKKRAKNKKLEPVDRCDNQNVCCMNCFNVLTCEDACKIAKERKREANWIAMGERFKMLREAAGVTRQQAFEADNNYLGYENGYYQHCNSEVLIKFSKLFGCTSDAILGIENRGERWTSFRSSPPDLNRDVYIMFGDSDRVRKVFYTIDGNSAQFCEPSDHNCVLSISFFDIKWWCYPPKETKNDI